MTRQMREAMLRAIGMPMHRTRPPLPMMTVLSGFNSRYVVGDLVNSERDDMKRM